MLVIILVLTILYAWKFSYEAKEDFFQLNYDWEKEKTTKEFGAVSIDSISYNFISFEERLKVDHQKTYKLTLQNKYYYFRFVYNISDNSNTQLSGLEWITDIPNITEENYHLEEVSLPLQVNSGPTVLSLGDEQLFENEAKYFRRILLKRYPVNFKGDFKDVFNFPYQAKKGNTVKDLIKQSETISTADFYILFFGLQENSEEIPSFKTDAQKLLDNLLDKNPEKIILFTLPPSNNLEEDEKHKEINKIFREVAQREDIALVDTYKIFSENPAKYLRIDYSISRDGYYELAKASAKIIKNAN